MTLHIHQHRHARLSDKPHQVWIFHWQSAEGILQCLARMAPRFGIPLLCYYLHTLPELTLNQYIYVLAFETMDAGP